MGRVNGLSISIIVLLLALGGAATALSLELSPDQHPASSADGLGTLAAMPGVASVWTVHDVYGRDESPVTGSHRVVVAMTDSATAAHVHAVHQALPASSSGAVITAGRATLMMRADPDDTSPGPSAGSGTHAIASIADRGIAEALIRLRDNCRLAECQLLLRPDHITLHATVTTSHDAVTAARQLRDHITADPALRERGWDVNVSSDERHSGRHSGHDGRIGFTTSGSPSDALLDDLDTATQASDAALSLTTGQPGTQDSLALVVSDRGKGRAAYRAFHPLAERHGLPLRIFVAVTKYGRPMTDPLPESELT